MTGRDMIETSALSHSYGEAGHRKAAAAIKDVSVKILEGEVVAIVGQNGAGKTTLAKHFNGLLRPTTGKVFVDGTDSAGRTVAELSRTVGYVFQDPDRMIFLNTVEDELRFGPRNLSVPPEETESRMNEVAEQLELKEFFGSPPFLLSRAAKRRLATASVLAMDPRVLVMDEPSSGQDRARTDRLMAYIERLNSERKLTVILITHDMRLVAEHAQRVLVMSGGELIYDGAPRELFPDEATLRRSGLEPPQITQMTIAMPDRFAKPCLSVDEAANELTRSLVPR